MQLHGLVKVTAATLMRRAAAQLAEEYDKAMCLDAAIARAETRARDQQVQAYQLTQHCQDSTWDLNRPDRLKLQQPSRYMSHFPGRRYCNSQGALTNEDIAHPKASLGGLHSTAEAVLLDTIWQIWCCLHCMAHVHTACNCYSIAWPCNSIAWPHVPEP